MELIKEFLRVVVLAVVSSALTWLITNVSLIVAKTELDAQTQLMIVTILTAGLKSVDKFIHNSKTTLYWSSNKAQGLLPF